MPLTFNTLLQCEAIDPSVVQLVRHQDARRGRSNSPYVLWRTNPRDFHQYQALQSRDVFRLGGLLASFVAAPISMRRTVTLFIGLYRIEAKRPALSTDCDPYGNDTSGHLIYDLQPDERLNEYQAKLIIDWGLGLRSWVQHAARQPKTILEISSTNLEPEFPGFLKFMQTLSTVRNLPAVWVKRLEEARGVYILTCPKTKEWYVGSATGAGGFFARWLDHSKSGGDATMLRSRDISDYQVSILEVSGTSASEQDILDAEYLWMEKLQTNKMGLNAGMLRNGRAKPMEA